MEYYSCENIRRGFNFYRSGKITSCCMQIDPELEIAHIDDLNIENKILFAQNKLIERHKNGNAPKVCMKCPSFQKRDWSEKIESPFYNIQLNHYRLCNLKCTHCGYRRNDKAETDTPHEAILPVLKKCIETGICSHKLNLEIGGGEPSLAKDLEKFLEKAIDYRWTAIINSNGAKFSEVFTNGVNQGLFTLLLTPDAGSPSTYAAIKGVDYFNITWRNIGRYMAKTNGNALVKFILEAGNIHDIAMMIDTSKKYGVKKLVLSMDMNIQKQEYPLYIAKAREFARYAHKAGLAVIRGAFLPDI